MIEQGIVNIADCGGKQPWFYQITVPSCVGCLAGFSWAAGQKFKSQLLPEDRVMVTNELHCIQCVMRKRDFCLCENKGADQLRGNHAATSTFLLATWIVQPICVAPGRKPQRTVFLHCGSIDF